MLELDELMARTNAKGYDHICVAAATCRLITSARSRPDRGTAALSLSLEAVELSEALRESIELVGPLAGEREIHISPAPVCDHYVVADRQRVETGAAQFAF